jgi:hypothetical protein
VQFDHSKILHELFSLRVVGISNLTNVVMLMAC